MFIFKINKLDKHIKK